MRHTFLKQAMHVITIFSADLALDHPAFAAQFLMSPFALVDSKIGMPSSSK